MSKELDILMLVTRRLDRAGLPYMVTGSMAMNYYAVPRMTRDIDIVIEVAEADVGEACVAKVDLLIRKPGEYRRVEFGRRRAVVVAGHRLFVVAPEDLILSKLDWARESRSRVQLDDVRNLLASVEDLDHGYLEVWIGRLGLEALYREVRG